MRRAALLAALALAAGSAGCSAGQDPPDSSGLAGLVETPGLAHDHVDGPLTYAQVPPVGGPHDPYWLRCEVYDAPVPPEFAVHSEEHGGVWLTYRPGLPADQVAALAALHDLDDTTREYVLVSPYDGLPSPVVAATWGLSLPVDSATDPRLERFVRTYAGGGQGGEKGVPCTSSPNALTPDQARQLLAAPPG